MLNVLTHLLVSALNVLLAMYVFKLFFRAAYTPSSDLFLKNMSSCMLN